MKLRAFHLAWMLLAAGVILSAASPWNDEPPHVRLFVEPAEAAWNDPEIESHLLRRMSRYTSVTVSPACPGVAGEPGFPTEYHRASSLIDWGKAVDADYVVLVRIDSERLDKRKDVHVPLLFHRYVTIGVIEGELRVFDIGRGRLEIAEPFRVEKKGPRAFQATMDDDKYDPDLNLTAPDKLAFFRVLEEELAGSLVKRIGSVIRMR